MTHVNISPPIIIFAACIVVGVYVTVACDTHRLWIPGRKTAEEDPIGA